MSAVETESEQALVARIVHWTARAMAAEEALRTGGVGFMRGEWCHGKAERVNDYAKLKADGGTAVMLDREATLLACVAHGIKVVR